MGAFFRALASCRYRIQVSSAECGFSVAPRLDELVQIGLAHLEYNIGQLASKQLVSQPKAIGVDDISFTIISDIP